MALFRRRNRPGVVREADSADSRHLAQFAKDHRGVEGFIEPATQDSTTTLVLVAHDGEWTRRRVASPKAAFDLGRELAMPVYEVAAVGYPQRFRDWNSRHKGS